MAWHSFKDVANKHLKKSGLEHKIYQATIIERANNLLLEWFGEVANIQAQAIYLQGPILVIAVLDGQTGFYLETREKNFVSALNLSLGQDLVRGLLLLK